MKKVDKKFGQISDALAAKLFDQKKLHVGGKPISLAIHRHIQTHTMSVKYDNFQNQTTGGFRFISNSSTSVALLSL